MDTKQYASLEELASILASHQNNCHRAIKKDDQGLFTVFYDQNVIDDQYFWRDLLLIIPPREEAGKITERLLYRLEEEKRKTILSFSEIRLSTISLTSSPLIQS
ncbi:MAG: hypothetical protein K1X63_08530 [Chitinophagales bacterium]|nr:hypothetical protein [Chitinophagales bacterium]